jgi:hypothetical protein
MVVIASFFAGVHNAAVRSEEATVAGLEVQSRCCTGLKSRDQRLWEARIGRALVEDRGALIMLIAAGVIVVVRTIVWLSVAVKRPDERRSSVF